MQVQMSLLDPADEFVLNDEGAETMEPTPTEPTERDDDEREDDESGVSETSEHSSETNEPGEDPNP